MLANLLSSLDLKDYELSEDNFSLLNEKTISVTKWNWPYEKAHHFQRQALQFVQENPCRVLISTSHPEVLTHGRGLQRPTKGEIQTLKEFRIEDHDKLPYPLKQIERGGGLTFHHPGQFIFYPILKLNPKYLSLSKMMNEIFDFSIDVLNGWGIRDLHHENKSLGLWHHENKLASMGIAIEKMTTYHGMALNLFHKPEMKSTLKNLSPCGINSDTYISVEELTTLPGNALETFKNEFLKRVKDEWQI